MKLQTPNVTLLTCEGARHQRDFFCGLAALHSIVVGTRLASLSSAGACKLLKRGISSQAIGPLGDYLGLGKGVIAEYLDLDRSTANRRAAKGQLLPIHSAECVLRLLELGQMATDTFETEDEASAWLRRPHPMLDGGSPLELAKTRSVHSA